MSREMVGQNQFRSVDTLELHPRINANDEDTQGKPSKKKADVYIDGVPFTLEEYLDTLRAEREAAGRVARVARVTVPPPLRKSTQIEAAAPAPSPQPTATPSHVLTANERAQFDTPAKRARIIQQLENGSGSAFEKLAENVNRFCARQLGIGVPTINWFSAEEFQDGLPMLGWADQRKQTIYLWTGIPDAGHLVSAVAHECFHLSQPSTNWEFAINRQRREREAYEYGFRIATAWQNNPSLFD